MLDLHAHAVCCPHGPEFIECPKCQRLPSRIVIDLHGGQLAGQLCDDADSADSRPLEIFNTVVTNGVGCFLAISGEYYVAVEIRHSTSLAQNVAEPTRMDHYIRLRSIPESKIPETATIHDVY